MRTYKLNMARFRFLHGYKRYDPALYDHYAAYCAEIDAGCSGGVSVSLPVPATTAPKQQH